MISPSPLAPKFGTLSRSPTMGKISEQVSSLRTEFMNRKYTSDKNYLKKVDIVQAIEENFHLDKYNAKEQIRMLTKMRAKASPGEIKKYSKNF